MSNKKTWKPNESDINETQKVFNKQTKELISKINKYWYNGEAKNQSIEMIKAVLDKHKE